MEHEVIEVQDRKTTRVYNIVGPKAETVESFWNWLERQGTIQTYSVTTEN